MKITITEKEYKKLLDHAKKELPNEACGLIAGADSEGVRKVEEVFILTNADHTKEHFSIDPREQLAAVRLMRAKGLLPLGNWHSHPETPSRPSEEDKRLANDSKASYLILSLEDPENPVLNAFHIEGPEGEKSVRKEELIILKEETWQN